MGRVIWVVCVIVGACYSPAPVEDLGCSETAHCPPQQSCDTVFHVCTRLPLCKPAAIQDAFAAEPACGGFGHVFGNGNTDIIGGHLVIDPNPDFTSGCDSDSEMPFADDGMWIEVGAVMPDHGSVGLNAQAVAPDPNYSPALSEQDGKLTLFVAPAGTIEASATYDPIAMRWWRLRPDRVADVTIAETAPDGIHWSVLGMTDISPPTIVRPQISAARDGANPAAAEIDGLDICPPGTRPPT